MGKIKDRNREIIRRHDGGTPAGVLASEYGLAEKTIECIVARARQRPGDTGRDRLADDADRKLKMFERLGRIRTGDVVRIRHESAGADGIRRPGFFTGTVIYRSRALITVQGEYYAESFQLFDLVSDLAEHIPT